MLHRTNTAVLPTTEDERLAAADLHQNHVRDLENQITELAAHLDAATFRWLELVREFDETGGWFGDGLKSSATAPALLYLLRPCSRTLTG